MLVGMRPGVAFYRCVPQLEVMSMIELMWDTEPALLILPVVVMTPVLGQVIEACVSWLRREVRLTLRRVAA